MGTEFAVELAWVGGKDSLGRAAGHADVPQSAGAAYGGDPTRWNPEELYGLALSQCHFLTFLALLDKIKVPLVSYVDRVVVTLDKADGAMRVTKVALRPEIGVPAGADAAKVAEMFHKAHKYCFVANSITAAVELAPTVTPA